LAGSLYQTKPHGSFEEFSAQLANNPDMARWKSELLQKRAAVAIERSKSVSDVTVSAGTKYLAELEDTAFVVGVSIALPIFDRNQGNIGIAQARLNKAHQLARQADVSIAAQLVDVYQSMVSAYEQTVNLRDTIIPASEKAFDAAREGYTQGKFAYLNLLDAQRTLFQAKQQYLNLLVLYHQTHADLERLVGGSLEFETTQNK
jgi:cobalt-zinc-cadmium efflux system outer membrane protein